MQHETTQRGEGDFVALKRRVAAAGLLDRQPAYQAFVVARSFALLASAWAFVAWAQRPGALAVAAVLLGAAFSQVGLLAHDAAHHQVFTRARWNRAFALFLFDFVVGLSLAWWAEKHGRHHAHPNQREHDPDAAPVVLAFSAEEAQAVRGWRRHLVRWQAPLFFPLLLLEGFNLRLQSVLTVWRGVARAPRPGAGRGAAGAPWLEACALALHFALYLGALLAWHGPLGALGFVVVHHMAMGVYLGCVFAPNHIGMAVLPEDTRLDFLRRQVTTGRNVGGGPLVDFLFGGLNHQIEHHLFPSMARNRLSATGELVRGFCAERGIPYRRTGLLAAYGEVLSGLARAGGAGRGALATTPSRAERAGTRPTGP